MPISFPFRRLRHAEIPPLIFVSYIVNQNKNATHFKHTTRKGSKRKLLVNRKKGAPFSNVKEGTDEFFRT